MNDASAGGACDTLSCPVHPESEIVLSLLASTRVCECAPQLPSTHTQTQVVPNPLLSVTPDRARVPPDGTAELEVAFSVAGAEQFATVLELEVRGGKAIKIPIK